MAHTPDHRIEAIDEHVNSCWDNSLPPVVTVESGDTVEFECRDTHDGQITHETTAEELSDLDPSCIHPLTGPVEIEGATAGDVLEVELLDFQHTGFGYTAFFSDVGKGLLPEEFDEDGLYTWELEDDIGYFVDGIEVPLDPFPGTIGIAPEEPGQHPTIPPRSAGGNMDIKHLTSGSTLYLPTEVDGGLFSIGDCHAAQGDGEVCITGIEAPMTVTARFSLRPDMEISQPQFKTDHPFTPSGQREPMYGTTGIGDNLYEASQAAIRHMISHLEAEHGLSKAHAYILCSVAVDLKLNEVVNEPNYVVSAYLPESLFA